MLHGLCNTPNNRRNRSAIIRVHNNQTSEKSGSAGLNMFTYANLPDRLEGERSELLVHVSGGELVAPKKLLLTQIVRTLEL